ncbi:MAG TPA: hypothetical protein VE591_09770 [Candidatus Acidoferrum sp.]|nr:hypothetical protein [Candidatus Acidoferrum sp.]
MMIRHGRLLGAFAFAALMLVATGGLGGAEIPTGGPVDGIRCDTMEGSVLHIHQHLAVLDHGRSVGVPDDVGRPLVAQCFYWLHTHTPDGIIHVESPSFRTFTLGNFFDIWGQPLNRDDVAGARPKPGERIVTWVDGHRYAGNPRAIELTQHLDVTLEVGPPYTKPAPFTAWNGN